MAVLAITESPEMKEQGVRTTKPVEVIKVVANASLTSEGSTYTYKKIKRVVGVQNAGPFVVTVNNTTRVVTVTPIATVAGGTYFITLVGE